MIHILGVPAGNKGQNCARICTHSWAAMPDFTSKHDGSEEGRKGGILTKFCQLRAIRDGDNERKVRAGTTTLTMILVFALCRHRRKVFMSIRMVCPVFSALHPTCLEPFAELLHKTIQHRQRGTGFTFAVPNKGALPTNAKTARSTPQVVQKTQVNFKSLLWIVSSASRDRISHHAR